MIGLRRRMFSNVSKLKGGLVKLQTKRLAKIATALAVPRDLKHIAINLELILHPYSPTPYLTQVFVTMNRNRSHTVAIRQPGVKLRAAEDYSNRTQLVLG
nr:hypothetical protein Itr_chr12CG18930 [Ipomoea trifida]